MHLILIARPKGKILQSFQRAAAKLDVSLLIAEDETILDALDPYQRYFFYSATTKFTEPNYFDLEEKIKQEFNVITLGDRVTYSKFNRHEIFELSGLPIARTEYIYSHTHLAECEEKIQKLGGFPIIVRAPDKQMKGRGVVKINSLTALCYLLPFLPSDKTITLQQFIAHNHTGRLIVVGDEVIASYCNPVHSDEFRSNVFLERDRVQKIFPDNINEIAIRATQVSGVEFAGVDLIFDQDDNPYVTEVNFPCNFIPAEENFDIPVSEKIIEYFIQKSQEYSITPSQLVQSHQKLVLFVADTDSPGQDVHALQKAARFQHLPVETTTFDELSFTPSPDTQYLLYRSAAGHMEDEVAFYFQYDCVSLSRDYPVRRDPEYRRNVHYERHNIPHIPKISVCKADRNEIANITSKLGGYPILISAQDSQGDARYLYADDYQTLISLCDYAWTKSSYITLQPFLNITTYGRLVVLGDNCIASAEYIRSVPDQYGLGDKHSLVSKTFSSAVQQIAIQAARSMQFQFAAVQVCIDATGQCYVDDVFFPFHFTPMQRATRVNIADKIITHLLEQAKT